MSSRRIDTVVRIRRLQEQLASAEVALAQHHVRLARKAEREAWQLLDDRTVTRIAGPRPVDELRAARTLLAGGMVHATGRGEVTATAAHHADHAISDWRLAAQRLDGIERLSDRLVAAERAEDERREGVELDDLVVMRWRRTS